MQVGDLVEHRKKKYLGVIIRVGSTGVMSARRVLYYIRWFHDMIGDCWANEVELVSASR